jgi:hypothetical protein
MEQRTIIFDLIDAHTRELEQQAARNDQCRLAHLTAESGSLRRRIGRWLISAGERLQGNSLSALPPLSATGRSN